MAYLTDSKLNNVFDLPISLPATEIKMGDWMIVSSVKIVQPLKLTYRWCSLQLISASVSLGDITSANRVYGNLGNLYLALRKDYVSGAPGAAGAIEVLSTQAIGITTRSVEIVRTITEPGTYSWIIANNCKADSASTIDASVSIDFVAQVTGQVRLETATA